MNQDKIQIEISDADILRYIKYTDDISKKFLKSNFKFKFKS